MTLNPALYGSLGPPAARFYRQVNRVEAAYTRVRREASSTNDYHRMARKSAQRDRLFNRIATEYLRTIKVDDSAQ